MTYSRDVCARERCSARVREGCRDCDGVVDLEMMCARIRARLVVRRDDDAASEGASRCARARVRVLTVCVCVRVRVGWVARRRRTFAGGFARVARRDHSLRRFRERVGWIVQGCRSRCPGVVRGGDDVRDGVRE